MKAFKKIIFSLSIFCFSVSAYGMSISSLRSTCIKEIANNIEKYSPEEIAQMPEVLRNALVLKEIIKRCGIMRCSPCCYFGKACFPPVQPQFEHMVRAVAATTDNKIIAGNSCYVYVWGMDNVPLAVCKGHTGTISSVAVTKNNKIISGSYDKTIRIWDIEGNQHTILEGHSAGVTAVAVSYDDKIISGSDDKTIRIWGMDGSKQAICIGHTDYVTEILISQDNKIISASRDATIRVWDIEGNQRAEFKGAANSLIALTPDNKIIVKDSEDGFLSVWDIDGKFQEKLNFDLPSPAKRLAVTHDNKIVFTCRNGNAYIYDMDGNQIAICDVRSIFGDDQINTALAVNQDHKIILGYTRHTGFVYDFGFLNRLEKINAEQAVRILTFVRNSSEENLIKWVSIKKIVNEPIGDSASKVEVESKLPVVQANSYNSDKKVALALVAGLAGWFVYKMFTSSSDY